MPSNEISPLFGEAAARIDKSFRDLHPSVDWRQVKDFRNIIVHDYFGIDDAIVWDIIQMDLSSLEKDVLVFIQPPVEYAVHKKAQVVHIHSIGNIVFDHGECYGQRTDPISYKS
jgi:hypothetical protein